MLAGTPLPQMWVALVIQFPCACPEGPALGWEGEEVLEVGRGYGGALRGPVVQLVWMLRSHGITVTRDRVVPRLVLG